MDEWQKISPGVLIKPLGGIEKVYRKISHAFVSHGREHWGLCCTCSFSLGTPSQLGTDEIATALRGAWKALRRDFPGLASVPAGLATKEYHTCKDRTAATEEWAAETFFVEADTARRPEYLLASYLPRDLPSLHYFPTTSQVTLLVSHWRMDGLGACMVLDRLFAHVAGAAPPMPGTGGGQDDDGSDLARMPPALEDACGAAPTGPDLDPALDVLAREYIDDHHRKAVHAGGLPFLGDAATPPGAPAQVGIVLTTAATDALVAACRVLKVSVTAAVQAALAEVVFARGVDPGATQYSAVVSANMRPRLPPPHNSPASAVATYVVGVTPVVARADRFSARAAGLTAFYRDWWTPQFSKALRRASQLHAEALFGTADGSPAPRPARPPSNVSLSSLGVVERHLGGRYLASGAQGRKIAQGFDVTVTDFQFGVSMMTRQMLLYVWTFGSRLNLSVNFNDAYHSRQSAREFLHFVRDVLAKELQLTLEVEKKIPR
ncbi:hypothetical protein RB595_006329 [Gaeumannomyces hyphopodioides]